MSDRFVRVAAPATKPDDWDPSVYYKVKKRGWYCPNYLRTGINIPVESRDYKDKSSGPEKKCCYDGEDYLSQVVKVDKMTSFFEWTLNRVLTRFNMDWELIQKYNPGVERMDFVQEAIVRVLELRSDPRGKDNWKFFANIGESTQHHYLRSLKRHQAVRLDFSDDIYEGYRESEQE